VLHYSSFGVQTYGATKLMHLTDVCNRQGEEASYLYVIVSGVALRECAVGADEEIASTLGPATDSKVNQSARSGATSLGIATATAVAENEVEEVRAGDLVGEEALLNNALYTRSLTAQGDIVVCVLDPEVFNLVFQSFSHHFDTFSFLLFCTRFAVCATLE
jgi:CRP-like cAMP-binding protein